MEWLLLAIFCFVAYYFYRLTVDGPFEWSRWFLGVFGIVSTALAFIIILSSIR